MKVIYQVNPFVGQIFDILRQVKPHVQHGVSSDFTPRRAR